MYASMGTVLSSLVKKTAVASVLLYGYKVLALQPQGQLLTLVKSWLLYVLAKTSRLRRWVGTKSMITDYGRVPVITFFHAPSDPHSTLTLQALKLLVTKYKIHLLPKIVSPLRDKEIAGHSSEYDVQWKWGVRDAAMIAQVHGLRPLTSTTIDANEFNAKAVLYDTALTKMIEILFEAQRQAGNAVLFGLNAEYSLQFLNIAIHVGDVLFNDLCMGKEIAGLSDMSSDEVALYKRVIAANHQELKSLGHYLPGMLYLKPEFYWGVDRLFHLEERLLELNLGHDDQQEPLFVENYRLKALTVANPQKWKFRPPSKDIVLYYSFRSPYSQLAVDRIYTLSKVWGVQVHVKPVLPMVMRGFTVAQNKGLYIVSDAMREAVQIGFPWSAFADPVGAGTIRAFVVWYGLVVPEKKEEAFLRAFSICVWAEAVDVATDVGMKIVVEKSGLDWNAAKTLLRSNNGLGVDNWRELEQVNQGEMINLGLWGVPSFTYGEHVFWGQDRIRILEDVLLKDMAAGEEWTIGSGHPAL